MQNRAGDQALQAECCCVRRGNRVFQFFLKYFTAFTVMLVIILVLQDLIPAVRAPQLSLWQLCKGWGLGDEDDIVAPRFSVPGDACPLDM